MNNKMHGTGVFTWQDGRRYEGEYRNDLKDGFGIYTDSDGKVYEGGWEAGKQDGVGFFQTNGMPSKRKGIWINGQRIKWLDE